MADSAFAHHINDWIIILKDKYKNEADKGLKWDIIKSELRNLSIQYSKRKAKSRRDRIFELEKKINDFEKNLSTATENEILNYKCDKIHLDELIDLDTQGKITRSKADWIEHGEKNTKFFANLEKKL